MPFLSKDQILAADDIPTEDVEVPEWGGTVRVRGMTAQQRSLMDATLMTLKGESVSVKVDALASLRQRVMAMCLVDENGDRLFSDKDIDQLAQKNAGVLDRLFGRASKLSGLSDGDVEEMAETFAEAQSEA